MKSGLKIRTYIATDSAEVLYGHAILCFKHEKGDLPLPTANITTVIIHPFLVLALSSSSFLPSVSPSTTWHHLLRVKLYFLAQAGQQILPTSSFSSLFRTLFRNLLRAQFQPSGHHQNSSPLKQNTTNPNPCLVSLHEVSF